MLILTDIHGCWFTLVRLLNQCAKLHPDEKLVFLGDEIDRGPHSRQVVEFAMEHKIPTVMGNHIDLCLAYSAHVQRGYKAHCARDYERDIWLWNGGEDALGNWPRFAPEGYICGNEIPKDVLDWMQELPPYIEPDAPLDENGRSLFLSHNGHGLAADEGNWYRALWARDIEFPDDGRFRVFGHTSVKTPQITESYAAIDTGAAYADRGGGIMTAFIWPSKQIVQQAFDETPAEAQFKIVDGRVCPLDAKASIENPAGV